MLEIDMKLHTPVFHSTSNNCLQSIIKKTMTLPLVNIRDM